MIPSLSVKNGQYQEHYMEESMKPERHFIEMDVTDANTAVLFGNNLLIRIVFSYLFLCRQQLRFLLNSMSLFYELTCIDYVGDPCYKQTVNVPARIDFHVHWVGLISQTHANFWTETSYVCENGANVENTTEVGDGWIVAYSVHDAVELEGFNTVLETPEGQETQFHNDGTITEGERIEHPELCAGPLLGYCQGSPSYSMFPSTGCATGFVNHGGICEKSWTFQGNCADPPGYEPEHVVAQTDIIHHL